ncbi:MAG TPA: hypothetical protein VNB90_07975 [Cytophagaceae bacterium]|nr:hypothetical protein [Cytophagaceae bacterium]
MQLFLQLLQLPVLVFLIQYVRKKHSDPLFTNTYYFLVSYKVTAGFFITIIYFYYYIWGDTLLYASDLALLSDAFYYNVEDYIDLVLYNQLPGGYENYMATFSDLRAYLFVRLVSPLYLLTGSNYWILVIYLTLFSFAGFWKLSDVLIRFYKLNPLAVMISFFLMPSVVFWSSGVMKESLIMGILTFIVSFVLEFVNTRKIKIVSLILLPIFLFLLLQLKFYCFAILVAVLFPYAIAKCWSPFSGNTGRIIWLLICIVVGGMLVSFSHPLLHIDIISESLYYNYLATLQLSYGKNLFLFEGLSTEVSSFIPYIPKALSFGLFGPFLWQCKKLISLASGIENTIILTFFAAFIINVLKNRKKIKIGIEEVSLILYVTVLALCMTFASPNWGSLVRYKVVYMPFFILLLLNYNPLLLQWTERSTLLKRLSKKE